MRLQLEPSFVLGFALGLVLLYLAGKLLLAAPFRMLLRFIASSVLGGAALVLLSSLGGLFGVKLALTPLNAVVVGGLGIPGVLLLLLLGLIFH
ncbi:MAG: pro-sigmaK processing inhibitor BofA family protein [Christensenellaceae bacterium]|nr:pro-sigmaK processing inhibitor BofA family protein [Christensenellaceae bacterium]